MTSHNCRFNKRRGDECKYSLVKKMPRFVFKAFQKQFESQERVVWWTCLSSSKVVVRENLVVGERWIGSIAGELFMPFSLINARPMPKFVKNCLDRLDVLKLFSGVWENWIKSLTNANVDEFIFTKISSKQIINLVK